MAESTFIGANAIIARQREAAVQAAEQSGEFLTGAQQEAAPVDTGTLRAGIHLESIDDAGLTVWATTSTGGESSAYSELVHEGTSAHIIRAKDGGYLDWPGAAHPVKEVHHPGTPANRYMSDPLLANVGIYEAAAAAAAAGEF